MDAMFDDLIFKYKGTISYTVELNEIEDVEIGDIYYCTYTNSNYVYTGTKWEPLDTTLAFSINTSSLSLEESPKKMVYKSITNCTNCNGILSWQSIYEPTIRCSYCGSILQKEVLT